MAMRTTVSASLVAVFGIVGHAAYAAEPPTCGPFSLAVEYGDMVFLDHGDPGISVGDERIGHKLLKDDAGNKIGDQYFEAVLMPGGGDGVYPVMWHGYSVFSNGQIEWGAAGTIGDPMAAANPGQLDGVSSSVNGGTGEFENATGTMTMRYNEESGGTIEFDITCPDY